MRLSSARWWGARPVKREPYRWGPQVEVVWRPIGPEGLASADVFDRWHAMTVEWLSQLFVKGLPSMPDSSD